MSKPNYYTAENVNEILKCIEPISLSTSTNSNSNNNSISKSPMRDVTNTILSSMKNSTSNTNASVRNGDISNGDISMTPTKLYQSITPSVSNNNNDILSTTNNKYSTVIMNKNTITLPDTPELDNVNSHVIQMVENGDQLELCQLDMSPATNNLNKLITTDGIATGISSKYDHAKFTNTRTIPKSGSKQNHHNSRLAKPQIVPTHTSSSSMTMPITGNNEKILSLERVLGYSGSPSALLYEGTMVC
jgi:hypothetical protein